jgi:hypothetical protein
MKKRDYIFNTLRESGGSDEDAKLYICTDVSTGKTEVWLQKTITQRFPIQELDKAEDLYERLTCGAGRRVYKPEDLAHPYNPTPVEQQDKE